MKTPFETLLEGQQKIMDFWTEAGKNVSQKISESVEKPKVPTDFLKTWLDNSQKIWEETARMSHLGNAEPKQPEMLKNWVKLQEQFTELWLNPTGEQWSKFNTGMSGFAPNLSDQTNPMNYLKDWVQKSQEWTEKALLNKLPSSQHQYMKNFNEVYDQMQKYWGPLQEMIRTNMHDRHQLNKLFGKDEYAPMIAKFMGFQSVVDPEALQAEMQESYKKFWEWLEKNPTGMLDWTEQIKKFNDLISKAEGSPHTYLYDLNRMISEGLDSYLSMSGNGKDIEMMKLMKEIQFAYFGFISKFTEMQQQVYNASYKALPESLDHFSEQYQVDKTLPDFQEYFKHFVNSLEKHVTETFSSKEYSKLQSIVAESASNVKSLTGKLIELAAGDLPFLTNSFADEVAMENRTLRKKIRSLEQRLEKLEQSLAEPPEPEKKGKVTRQPAGKAQVKSQPAKKAKVTRQRSPVKNDKTEATSMA